MLYPSPIFLKGVILMFQAAEQLAIELIPFIPGFIGIWLVFDFTGMLFGNRG